MKKTINSFVASTFIYFIMSCSFIEITLNSIISLSRQDGIISVIIGIILGIIPLLLYLYLINYNKNLNFTELVEYSFGKKIGKIFNYLLCMFVIIFTSLLFFELITFVNNQYLSKTPIIIIGITFIIPCIYLLSKGISVIGKSAVIFFYINFILLLISFTSLIFNSNINNIFPLFQSNISNVLSGSYQYIGKCVLPLFLLLTFKKNQIKDQQNFNKRFLFSYILVSFILLGIMFITIAIHGIELTTLYEYPLFNLFKNVSIIGFIGQLESILSLQWIIDIFFSVVLGIYFVYNYFEMNCSITKKITTNIVISIISSFILIISLSLFKNNIMKINSFISIFPLLIYIVFLGFPLLIAIISFTKKST